MSRVTYDAVDLFAGPGGWDIAAKWLGLRVIGVEMDAAACATRKAAGLNTVKASVLDVNLDDFVGIKGLIASPPCQTFSAAGKGAGREALDKVLLAVDELASGRDPWQFIDVEDVRTRLVLEPLRWALYLRPEWIAWEQVPPVLPVWERCAEALRSAGYSVTTGLVSSEQYGVPQTRKRAILVARRGVQIRNNTSANAAVREESLPSPTLYFGSRMNGVYWEPVEASLPAPSHTKYAKGKPRQAGDLLPWVSMADALGWGMTHQPSMTVTGGGTSTGGAEPFGNAARRGIEREAQAGRYIVAAGVTGQGRPPAADAPAPTMTGKGTAYLVDDETAWVHERPSTTVVGSFAPDIQAAPGYREAGDGPRQNAPGSVRITVQQAAILQSFPADYPWQGAKTKQFQQVGNAIPPKLAERVLLAALGHPEVPADESAEVPA